MVPAWFFREIRIGDSGPDVETFRRILGLGPGPFDESCLVLLQTYWPGCTTVTETIAEAIGPSEAERAKLPPLWFVRELGPGDSGDDVESLHRILGVAVCDTYCNELENAVRRFQSQREISPSGLVDETLAPLLGEAP